jgi:hypothetical protein
LPVPNWSRSLPRPIIIPDVMELAKLADVRIFAKGKRLRARQAISRLYTRANTMATMPTHPAIAITQNGTDITAITGRTRISD